MGSKICITILVYYDPKLQFFYQQLLLFSGILLMSIFVVLSAQARSDYIGCEDDEVGRVD